jgi:thiosulfate sulfurtransferase
MTTLPNATSIEQGELAGMLASGERVSILDVRRVPAFEKNPVLLPGAVRVAPDTVGAWAASSMTTRSVPVVVYCVHGHEVSQGAAAELQALGFAARFLQGGISEWQASGGSTTAP